MTHLTDNEVAEVAKMQKLIDDYEACFSCLFLFIRKDETPIMVKHGYDVPWFQDIEDFVRYIRDRHPDIMKEYRAKGRDFKPSYIEEPQEPSEPTQAQTKPQAKKRKRSLKQAFAVFLHLLFGH